MTDKQEQTTSNKFKQLRERAQAYLSAPSKEAESVSQEEVKKLIHELDTYQIELELQNVELRNAQEELSNSQQRFSDLYDFAPVGYLTISDKGLIKEANLTIANKLCVARENLLKKPLSVFITAEDQDVFYRCRKALLDTGKPQTCDLRMKRKDCSFFYAQLKSSITPSLDGNSGQFRMAVSDITEIKKLEEELFQSHKMEAIGTLAGGIAHDFNNILTIILGNAELIKAELRESSHLEDNIDELLMGGNRAKELVKQVITFSKKRQSTPKVPFQPQIIIREVLRMLRSSLPATIELEADIDPDCGTILADPTELHQVILNLCTNSFQAITNGQGTITVQLSMKSLGVEDIANELNVPPGLFVELKVRDTGCGIDSSLMNRIFEPYFTTKGMGSGIGLAVVYGIVKSNGGIIKVDSEIGKGSTFRIYLPSSTIHVEEEDEQKEAKAQSLPCTERILIVDDETMIIKCLNKCLANLGYTVTPHTNSLEALEDFSSRPHEFDLVITDQMMPNMPGSELARKILKIRDDIPVIMFSGYDDLVSKEYIMDTGIKQFLQKPVALEKLAKTVREVLEEQQPQVV